MNIQDWSPLGWTGWISLQSKGLSRVQHSSKASILWCSAFLTVQISHPYMTTGKTIALTRRTFVGKVMSLLFNMLSSLVITFLPRSKRLLISWLEPPSAVEFGAQKNKVSHCLHCLPIYFPWSDGLCTVLCSGAAIIRKKAHVVIEQSSWLWFDRYIFNLSTFFVPGVAFVWSCLL